MIFQVQQTIEREYFRENIKIVPWGFELESIFWQALCSLSHGNLLSRME